MVLTSAKKPINIVTSYHVISIFFHLILIFSLHCQLFLLISGYYTTCNIKITYQCKIIIVPEESWFGQPKYSTPTKKILLRCVDFCFYFLLFFTSTFGKSLIKIITNIKSVRRYKYLKTNEVYSFNNMKYPSFKFRLSIIRFNLLF